MRRYYAMPYRRAVHLGRHRRRSSATSMRGCTRHDAGALRRRSAVLLPAVSSSSRSTSSSAAATRCLVAHWSRSSLWLVIAGLACSSSALRRRRPSWPSARRAPYVPTHMENGRVVPGRVPVTPPRPRGARRPARPAGPAPRSSRSSTATARRPASSAAPCATRCSGRPVAESNAPPPPAAGR